MKQNKFSNSQLINGVALGFSLSFLIASAAAAFYTGETATVFADWWRILITPSPLVTDYFELGSLAAAFLNAGACGLTCALLMIGLKGDSRANTLAGFFLVVAHCFYGLNLLNMLPCLISPFLYLRLKKLDYKANLHICMFATCFSPFISEFLFRYTDERAFVLGHLHLTLTGIALALLFTLMIGFVIPAILPGAAAWHKGYNLYNGGLAFGLFGFFLYNFMYHTMGIAPVGMVHRFNPVYDLSGRSYRLFANVFYLTIFGLSILTGWLLNGKSFRGYEKLLKDTGHASDFSERYGMPACLINIGIHGGLFLLYINLAVHFTEGAGFTGPTFGVILASLTFSAMGQQPKNVWPILLGYQTLFFVTLFFCHINGRDLTWSLSTQGYINGVAFATGLCPIVGRYGRRAGVAAGFICASMCTATSALHGGLVLYNGGLTAGITALILLPILEHYLTPREEVRDYSEQLGNMITLIENTTPKAHDWYDELSHGQLKDDSSPILRMGKDSGETVEVNYDKDTMDYYD